MIRFHKFALIWLLGILPLMGYGQSYDSLRMAQLPKLSLPQHLKSSSLPYQVDNSQTSHFPPIIFQYGYSCHQAASVGYVLTYELNALRGLDASHTANRYPPFFTWTMMNKGDIDFGVSYFESFDLIKSVGCPTWADWGSLYNATRWMSGYYSYYRSMFNRIDGVFTIDVSTQEGLQTLKHWLFNHLGEHEPGGLALFQLATKDLQFLPLPEGTEEAGKVLIPEFGYAVGHAMTFVGYNDSVRYDFNGDGQYTNHLDITGDGQDDMTDWEIGALICANTYGLEWGTEGKAFVPYRILPLHPNDGGIWMKSVFVARPTADYTPLLTLRAKLEYEKRKNLWITAGVAQDTTSDQPEFILDQPIFRYQGGALPMQGEGTSHPNTIELGIDATPLLAYVKPNQAARFFLVLNELDPESIQDGMVHEYSFGAYFDNELFHWGSESDVPIDQPEMFLSTVLSPGHDNIHVTNSELPGAVKNQIYQHQLSAAGGHPPYNWSQLYNRFNEELFEAEFPEIDDSLLLTNYDGREKIKINLPFNFPYREKSYNQVEIHKNGGLVFEPAQIWVPYVRDLREELGMQTALFPFFSTEIVYLEDHHGVYYGVQEGFVQVTWEAVVYGESNTLQLKFAARLFSDGQIEFWYDEIHNRAYEPWSVALTGGEQKRSLFPVSNATGLHQGKHLRFSPLDLPEALEISSSGLLSCIPEEADKTWKIPVIIKDKQGLYKFDTVHLSTAAASDDLVSIDESTLTLYPNPATEAINIQVSAHQEGKLMLRLMDLSGRVILQKETTIQQGNNQLTIPLPDGIPAGIYVLQTRGIVDSHHRIYCH